MSSRMVALAGALVALIFMGSVLAVAGGDASLFINVGDEDPAHVAYATNKLGRPSLHSGAGHDGRYFFIQAHDPLILDTGPFFELMDRPVYRAQRMLYPLLASSGAAGGEWGIVLALVLINVVAVGAGTWAVARLALGMGLSPWWGLAFPLNPGMLAEIWIGGAGVLAWALAAVGLVLLDEGHYRWGVAAMTGAALAREVMLLAAVGAAAFLWRRWRRLPRLLLVVPAGMVAAWGAYARLRLRGGPFAADTREIEYPFVGWLRAADGWVDSGDLLRLGVGAAVLAAAAVAVYLAIRRPSLLTYAAVGFGFLTPFLTRPVWVHFYDNTRALAPALTAVVVAGAAHAAGRLRSDPNSVES